MTSRPSTAAPILAVLAIVLVMLGAYMGGYFWLGEYRTWTSARTNAVIIERRYSQEWQRGIYRPVAYVESHLFGESVVISPTVPLIYLTSDPDFPDSP
jgi:hypothetical protein